MNIWIILAVGALILLGRFWKGRNAVWGGLTIGIIIGVLWKIFGGNEWLIVAKTAIIGIFLGFGAELLGLAGNYFKRIMSKKDPIRHLADENSEVVRALHWLKEEEKLQIEFNGIIIKHGELEGPAKAQEWLLEKYRSRDKK